MLRFAFRSLLTIVLAARLGLEPAQAEDKVIGVPNTDGEMSAAIAKARQTLPEFWKAYDQPSADKRSFSLKVAITEGEKTEHFWLVDIEKKDGGEFEGTIDNDPNSVKTVRDSAIGSREIKFRIGSTSAMGNSSAALRSAPC